ncbi:MAG: ribonuclease HII [Chlamydiae bacterium]|nr:ribonuclease HII [Chlamydiota bacterium]
MNQLHSQELERLASLSLFETKARQRGYKIIAGVDEAGRGPLAGPVVAAACILPENCILPGLDDSKKLNELERAVLYKQITENPEIVSAVAVVACGTIDVINVLQASLYAMSLAIQKLSVQPEFVLVDGPYVPKIGMPAEAVVDGDALSASIAAASIIAKWTRDQIMEEYHQIWPEYGFDKHKGYATQLHRKAIENYGLCPIHRKSFAPVREAFLA